ncbi:hypothetical protein [Gracilinema caldarium]|uniref:Uncharacterized protein n=1 Tax=Gracilinema caldarium (strain ATCC 51460 / DSM 7334 / H1) TaxID=744872 RepID=F8EZY7_GRAC1|nr:hypothetical protein [Gracilinema caldarium]AEJ18500.1 hypothetical protein Spica_0335 [Gracilinema caldarium DSM 7334]
MKKHQIICLNFLFIVSIINGFTAGRADIVSGGKVKQARMSSWQDGRIIPVYVLSREINKTYIEGMYIPQGIAAYYPNQFTMNAKERRIQFENRYSYRILEKHLIQEDVWLYSVETSSTLTAPEHTKIYTIFFNRSSLVSNSGEAIQPATYALERGARMSGCTSGTVYIDSLLYNEKDKRFKAVVVVSP